jgi:hypothetical protein
MSAIGASRVARYSVTAEILEKARKLGMYGNQEVVVQRLCRLVIAATPISHPLGNALCNGWLLKIEGQSITNLAQITPDGADKQERLRGKPHAG